MVRGHDGVDEVSLEHPTMVLDVTAGQVEVLTWQPEEFGIQPQDRSGIFADSPARSAACILKALGGHLDRVGSGMLLNAAAGLWLAGLSMDLQECGRMAASAIDTGVASDLIKRLGSLTAT